MPYAKNIFLLASVLILVLSCSSDDVADNSTNVSPEATGTYSLTALNVSTVQDVNEDGNSSTNLVDEMNCLTGTLSINNDTSWSLNVIRINVTSITGGDFFIACGDADNNQGTWTFANGQISLHGGSDTAIYLLSNGILTRQINEDLPGFQSAVFTKQ